MLRGKLLPWNFKLYTDDAINYSRQPSNPLLSAVHFVAFDFTLLYTDGFTVSSANLLHGMQSLKVCVPWRTLESSENSSECTVFLIVLMFSALLVLFLCVFYGLRSFCNVGAL